jgi:hypothetical protein
MENNAKLPQRMKNRAAIASSNSTFRYLSKRIEITILKNPPVLIALLSKWPILNIH